MYKSGKLKALLIILVLAELSMQADQLLQPQEVDKLSDTKQGFTDIVQVFFDDASFKGEWTVPAQSNSNIFNGFVNKQGSTSGTFRVSVSNVAEQNNTQVILWFNDQKYIDTKSAYILFNLTNSTYVNTTSTFNLSGSNEHISTPPYRNFSVYYRDHLEMTRIASTVDCQMTMTVINRTSNGPYDIYQNESNATDNVKFIIDINSTTLGLKIQTELVKRTPEPENDLIFWICMVGIISCLFIVFTGFVKVVKPENTAVRNGQGVLSLMILSQVYSQYMGVFMSLMQEATLETYFVSYALGFGGVLMGSAAQVLAIRVWTERNINDPAFNERRFCAPRMKMAIISTVILTVNLIFSIQAFRFKWYAYYICLLSVFPLTAIVENSFRGVKRCFSVYTNIFMWWPTCLFGLMYRGVYTDIIGLEPVPWLLPVLVTMLLIGTIMTYLQSKYGTHFFLPSKYFPGHHQYLIPLSRVPQEKLDDDCIICFNPLSVQPMEQQHDHTVNSLQAPINPQATHCMATPCGHYFHEPCLLAWFDKKRECPICKRQIQYYE